MRFKYFIYNYAYKYILQLYLKKDANVVIDGMKLKVLKNVFHPKLFFSSRYFYDFIKKLELNNRRFLDIGCGSGILSLLAAKKGAQVTAIDISPKAIENTRFNFSKNFKGASPATVIQSDLFKNVPKQAFDVIVINPPYFFKNVVSEGENAWYCGANGEYFESLFADLLNYMHQDSFAFMILADNCDIERIRAIASKNKIVFTLAEEKIIKWEKNYIYRLKADH